MLIYKITNLINNKLYIGQTCKTLNERMLTHKNSMISGVNTHLYNAMRRYGWENFKFEVVCKATSQEELDELEVYYIDYYDTYRHGYNMTLGGSTNPMVCKAVKEKHDNIMRSESVRNKIRDSVKQYFAENGGVSEKTRKKLSDQKKSFYASESGAKAKQHFKETFKLSPEHFRALNDSKNKSVYCIDLDGNKIAEFPRVKDAADWWFSHGYGNVKDVNYLNDRIKESSKHNRYIRGLKWIYCE